MFSGLGKHVWVLGHPLSCLCILPTPKVVVDPYHCIYMQVLRLLGAMNLSQYQAKFVSEQVTGDILIELNDEHLESELQIKSKIHRVRLMKIIEGQHSAKSIIEGESPYSI